MLHIIWFILWTIGILSFITFTFVIFFGAPFLPTLKQQVPLALDMIDLKSGQTLLELGSGDGRVLIEAAKRGLFAVGYELNPVLVIYSKIKSRKYKKQIKIIWGNYWIEKWPPVDGIFVFLLQPYMEKLNNKVSNSDLKPIKLISFAFNIESRQPVKTRKGLYLYSYK